MGLFALSLLPHHLLPHSSHKNPVKLSARPRDSSAQCSPFSLILSLRRSQCLMEICKPYRIPPHLQIQQPAHFLTPGQGHWSPCWSCSVTGAHTLPWEPSHLLLPLPGMLFPAVSVGLAPHWLIHVSLQMSFLWPPWLKYQTKKQINKQNSPSPTPCSTPWFYFSS